MIKKYSSFIQSKYIFLHLEKLMAKAKSLRCILCFFFLCNIHLDILTTYLFFISTLSYLTLTPQMQNSVPQISQLGHFEYSKLLLITYVSKINSSKRNKDMYFFFQERSAFVESGGTDKIYRIYGL